MSSNDIDIFALVKIGTYEQDASDGEYGGETCFGLYLEVSKCIPREPFKDDIDKFSRGFPEYQRTSSPFSFFYRWAIKEAKIVGNIYDNPELILPDDKTIGSFGVCVQECCQMANAKICPISNVCELYKEAKKENNEHI